MAVDYLYYNKRIKKMSHIFLKRTAMMLIFCSELFEKKEIKAIKKKLRWKQEKIKAVTGFKL